jgi:hypothetical protein
MRVAAATRGYKPRVYQPKMQKYSQAHRDVESLIVTPRYDQWLLQHPEMTADRKTFEHVMRLMTVPPRDRRRSFSASQAGYCLRRQELAFLGVPRLPMIDPRGVRIFQNGTMVHLRWQVGLLSAKIVDGIEVTVKSRSGLARATLDGIGVAVGGRFDGASFGWEHKGRISFSFDAQNKAGTPDEKTRKQVAMQSYLTGFEVFSVTNEHKNEQHHAEFVLEYNEEEVKEVRTDIAAMILAVEKGRLHPMLPECIKRNSSGEYYKCPFGTDLGACASSGHWPRGV